VEYLLDTNICIYVIKQHPSAVVERFLAHEEAGIAISSITAAELYYGVSKTGSAKNRRILDKFISPLTVLEFDLRAARAYGEVRAALESKGVPIGPLDTQLAAHALTEDLTFVTNNQREFKRVPGLRVENWIA
jgi:tRNA(fMet)-specific endonuclease VapC